MTKLPLIPSRDITIRWVISFPTAPGQPTEARLTDIRATPWSSVIQIALPSSERSFDSLTLHILLKCDESWFLSAERIFRKLEGDVSTLRPLGKFLVVGKGSELYRLEVPQASGLDLAKRDDGVEIAAPIFSRRLCGLTLWGADKLAARPAFSSVELHVNRLEDLGKCPWIEPYPDGVPAAICLTDHADFDSAEKVEILANVFGRHRFRCTKSVFPGPKMGSSVYGPGLDNSSYRAQIRRLREQGSEICFHGFTSDRDAPPIGECLRRIDSMAEFAPQTWIDHGTGSYLLSRTARLGDGTSLVGLLSRYGIVNYWSYTDIWNNPIRHIASWGLQRRSISGEFFYGLKRITHKSVNRVAYLGMHCVKNVMGDEGIATIRSHLTSVRHWAEAHRLSKLLASIRNDPLLLYGFNGGSYAANILQPWVFDTTLLNHLALQLSPNAIDDLIRRSGTLVGHCYFAEQHLYGFDNCFSNTDGRLSLLPEFEQDLAHIDLRRRQGELAVLTFSQLRRSLTSFARTRVERFETGWRIEVTDGDAPITVALPHSPAARVLYPAELRTVRGSVLYCLIPRAGVTTITLGSA